MAGITSSRVNTSVEGSTSAAWVRGMPVLLAIWRRKSAMASMDKILPSATMLSGRGAMAAFFSVLPAK